MCSSIRVSTWDSWFRKIALELVARIQYYWEEEVARILNWKCPNGFLDSEGCYWQDVLRWVWSIIFLFFFFFSPLVYLDFSQANFSFAPLVLDMLNFLMDAIQTNFQQASAVGSSSRAQQALRELHTVDKVVEMTDQLMVSVAGTAHKLRWCGVLDHLGNILRMASP